MFYGNLTGKVFLQVHSGCWKDSFLCVCRIEGPGFLLALGWRFLSAPRGLPQFVIMEDWLLLQASMENLSVSLSARWSPIWHQVIVGVTFHHLCHILSLRSKSQFPPTLKEKKLHRAWTSENGSLKVTFWSIFPPYITKNVKNTEWIGPKMWQRHCMWAGKGEIEI